METLLLCLKIFFCRILDVSLGTTRNILSVDGRKLAASLLGFAEVMVWFLVVREALSSDVGGIWCAVAYSGGFSAGTYIGGVLASRVIKRNMMVEVVTSKRDLEMLDTLRRAGYAVSSLNVNPSAYGGEKFLLICELKAARMTEFRRMVQKLDPGAFLTVHETKYVYGGFIK